MTARDSKPVDKSTQDMGGYAIRIGNPQMWQVVFRRASPEEVDVDEDGSEPQFQLSLGVRRPDLNVVGVQLIADSDEDTHLEFHIECHIGILIEKTDPEAKLDYDVILRGVATRIGPVAVYPYIRELLANLSQRSGLQPILLPIMNVGALFDPESISLPEPLNEEVREAPGSSQDE